MKLIGIELQLMTNVRVVMFVTWFDTELFIGFIRHHPSGMVSKPHIKWLEAPIVCSGWIPAITE